MEWEHLELGELDIPGSVVIFLILNAVHEVNYTSVIETNFNKYEFCDKLVFHLTQLLQNSLVEQYVLKYKLIWFQFWIDQEAQIIVDENLIEQHAPDPVEVRDIRYYLLQILGLYVPDFHEVQVVQVNQVVVFKEIDKLLLPDVKISQKIGQWVELAMQVC